MNEAKSDVSWKWISLENGPGGFFSPGEVSKILDIPPRKVTLYCEQQLVAPFFAPEGRGRASRYVLTDLLRFAIVARLEEFGVKPRVLRRFSNSLPLGTPSRDHSRPTPLPAFEHLLERGEFWVILEQGEPRQEGEAGVVEVLRREPAAIVLNFRSIIENVLEQVRRFAQTQR